jgi:hypothetical protein
MIRFVPFPANVETTTTEGVCTDEENLYTLESAVEKEIAVVTVTSDVDLPTGVETGTVSFFRFEIDLLV